MGSGAGKAAAKVPAMAVAKEAVRPVGEAPSVERALGTAVGNVLAVDLGCAVGVDAGNVEGMETRGELLSFAALGLEERDLVQMERLGLVVSEPQGKAALIPEVSETKSPRYVLGQQERMREPRVLVEVALVKDPEATAGQGCRWIGKVPVLGGPMH